MTLNNTWAGLFKASFCQQVDDWNHEYMKITDICELRSEELFEGRPSQLYTQLMQLRKESLKKNSGLYGIRILELCDTGVALYQLSKYK